MPLICSGLFFLAKIKISPEIPTEHFVDVEYVTRAGFGFECKVHFCI